RVERFRSRHPVAIHAAAVAFGAQPVLNRLDLHVVPILREGIVDAAVVAELTIEIGKTLPDADGGEMLRLQARYLPLVDGVIRNTAQTDLAVRPRLHAGPLDAIMEVLRFARRPMLDVTGRAAATARVDTHACIAIRHPFLRIADLPALIFVGRAAHHVGMLERHAIPRGLVAVFKMQPFAVWAVAQEDRIAAFLDRPEHVTSQHQTVVHGDRHIPIDLHAITDFAHFTITHAFSLLRNAAAMHYFFGMTGSST